MSASRAQRAKTAERRGRAIALRLAGLEYQAIADRLGYASRQAARVDVERALQANLAEESRQADLLRQVELQRLDRLQAAAWPAAAGGDLRAIDTVLKVIDRRCKLLGLDAPIRAEVMTIDAIEANIAALTAQLAANDGSVDGVETGAAAGAAGADAGGPAS